MNQEQLELFPDARPASAYQVALIACSGRKAAVACSASDMYQGHLFRLSRSYVLRRPFTAWGILSAKHGLVLPEQVIAPYDQTMADVETLGWAQRVIGRLQERWPRAHVTILAGLDYTAPLKAHLKFDDVFDNWRRQTRAEGKRAGIGVLLHNLKWEVPQWPSQ